jgi:hypothetical protein
MRTHDYFGRPLTETEMQIEALQLEEARLVDFLAHGMDAETEQEQLARVRKEIARINKEQETKRC